jgi:hypothetical protein
VSKKKKRKTKVDPAILAELLEQPEIKTSVDQMTPEARDWYKELLVSQGIYDRYVKERKVN